jgi:hypothetical protein
MIQFSKLSLPNYNHIINPRSSQQLSKLVLPILRNDAPATKVGGGIAPGAGKYRSSNLWNVQIKFQFFNKTFLFLTDNPKGVSAWTKERIWTEAVEREAKSIKEWEEKFSFLAEYDPRVRICFIFFFNNLFYFTWLSILFS